MKLSIILTVYNKEHCLGRAFKALLSQKDTIESDFEIIVVNDGSTDDSNSIISGYEKADKRVRVLTQENQGLSMARNNGVSIAYGDYVWFVDADDVITLNAVNLVCDAINSSPDVIAVYANTYGSPIVRNAVPVNAKTGQDIILSQQWEQCGVFWIINRSFLLRNHLSFMPGIYHEDAEFTPRMLYYAKSVSIIPEVLYIVFQEQGSITNTPQAKRAFDCLTVAESLCLFIESNRERGSVIGNEIDKTICVILNNALSIVLQNEIDDIVSFNQCFYEKRETFLRPLSTSSCIKYRIEAVLFIMFPKRYVSVYRTLKRLSSLK